jgi:uncharacterized protein with ATP-grasp and redox domains
LIRELTGDRDPYRAAKETTNRLALTLYPSIRDRIRAAADPLEMAVRMAIAGNIIDLAVDGRFREDTLHTTLDRAATEPLHGHPGAFAGEVEAATSILYIADNAGEIVLDRVLIEMLGPERVTVVVRGEPILNDALLRDAAEASLDDIVEIVENGSDAPGTILEDCSNETRSRFFDADVVIAKGQGNYETLSQADRPVWFVLMAKCEVIARHLGCDSGALVLCRGGRVRAATVDA